MKREEKTTKLISEISRAYQQNGRPKRNELTTDGRDMGKGLTRMKTLELHLTDDQLYCLAMLDDFSSQTEKNIQELETFYEKNGCLPLGEDYKHLKDVMYSYKSGKVPLTESQKDRLEAIGVFLTNTERMIQAIEIFYDKFGLLPKKGDKSKEGYDMGLALIGYTTGKRQLTLEQKQRLEKKGVVFENALIKEPPKLKIRLIEEKETLSEQIKRLKMEKATLLDVQSELSKRL